MVHLKSWLETEDWYGGYVSFLFLYGRRQEISISVVSIVQYMNYDSMMS